jgi:hypothetical protein
MTGNRAGKSLVELSIVIGLLSVVMVLATRTITFLMQAEGAGRRGRPKGQAGRRSSAKRISRGWPTGSARTRTPQQKQSD